MAHRAGCGSRLPAAVLLAATLACSIVAPRPPTATPFPTLPLTGLPVSPDPATLLAPTPPPPTGTDWSPPQTGTPASATPPAAATPGRAGLTGQIVYTCFVEG